METPEFADLLSRAADDRPFPHGGIILAATPLGTALDASVRLIDALEDSDDVQNVYTNFDMTAEVQAELENDE